MRIGILGHTFVNWSGGIDFLRVVMSSLHHVRPDLEMHLLVPDEKLRPPLVRLYRKVTRKGLKGHIQYPASNHIDELMNSVDGAGRIHHVAPDHHALVRLAHALSLDALMPAHNPLPVDFPFPWIGYIADFQHRYLPQLFSERERCSRDAHFSTMLARAKTVIVNSKATAMDIERFHPEGRARVFSLPFSAAPSHCWFDADTGVASRYGIRNRYFLISNQFWKHKDHGTAFAAFAVVAAVYPEIHLVCTGPTDDYRDPQYFSSLQQFLCDRNIVDRVHILGMLAKLDQVELMRSSVALIQPTLFEGGAGGGAVYDAVSVGVHCLVSDIEVNRELSEALVTFFPAGNAAELARKMIDVLEKPCLPARDINLLCQDGVARRTACGQMLLDGIDHARST